MVLVIQIFVLNAIRGFTAAPFFVIALAWLSHFGLSLFCICSLLLLPAGGALWLFSNGLCPLTYIPYTLHYCCYCWMHRLYNRTRVLDHHYLNNICLFLNRFDFGVCSIFYFWYAIPCEHLGGYWSVLVARHIYLVRSISPSP
ncbi:hypothetical protein IFM89_032106 [Coptis chinensis]|uniref:Uncharacterized protein n=1 Tax=Coptis chinensis TaxID=261450 RepID=A0A835M047_9MAGN|nr:hypothetical protein IFM89_032106 [Coptis chinensis]